MAACGLVVELGAVCDGDLAGAAVDGEPAAGIVGERVARAVAGIGIGDRDRAHGGAVGAILVDAVAGEGQVGGRLVDVVDGDGEGLGVGEAAAVGDPHGDVVAAGSFVVQQGAIRDGDLAVGAVDDEPAAGIVDQSVGHAVAGIGVDADGDIDDRAVGCVFVDGGPEEDVGGSFVDVADGD